MRQIGRWFADSFLNIPNIPMSGCIVTAAYIIYNCVTPYILRYRRLAKLVKALVAYEPLVAYNALIG